MRALVTGCVTGLDTHPAARRDPSSAFESLLDARELVETAVESLSHNLNLLDPVRIAADGVLPRALGVAIRGFWSWDLWGRVLA